MHILIAVLGALATAIFFIYRIYMAARTGREMADKIGDPRRFVRRFNWSRKARGNPADTMDDPREAATLLMLAVARTEGELSDTARAAIQTQMREHFEMSAADADALFRQVAFMSRDMTDIGPRMRRLVTVLQRSCTRQEREELAAMLNEVALASGGLTPMRRQILQRYRQILREQDG